jgi:hypothetical protein
MRRHLQSILLVGVLIVLGDPVSFAGQDKKDKKTPDYYPLQVGNQWNYKLDVNGKEFAMINRIAKIVTINEKTYAVLESEMGGKVKATEHLRKTDKGIIRLRTNNFESVPPIVLVKNPVKPGDKWRDNITVMDEEAKHDAKYDAVAEEEMVKVPAGSFKTLRVAIRLEEGDKVVNTTYWFAPGVGFVKQTVEAPMVNMTIELEKYKLTKKSPEEEK